METLKIEVPAGYEIDIDKQSGVIKFKAKPKKVTERILSIDDVLKDHHCAANIFTATSTDTQDEKAYKFLKLLTKSLNEGWEPDWNNHNEVKYYPYFEVSGSSGFRFSVFGHWDSRSSVGSRLCFKSRELAEHAGKHFTEVYKQFMLIN